MNMIHEYKLRISDEFNGTGLTFKEFPELRLLYVSSENNLCPSNYIDAFCFWEGDLQVTLEFNGERFTLNDHDQKKNHKIEIQGYTFQGLKPIVENRSKDQTYLLFSVQNLKSL